MASPWSSREDGLGDEFIITHTIEEGRSIIAQKITKWFHDSLADQANATDKTGFENELFKAYGMDAPTHEHASTNFHNNIKQQQKMQGSNQL